MGPAHGDALLGEAERIEEAAYRAVHRDGTGFSIAVVNNKGTNRGSLWRLPTTTMQKMDLLPFLLHGDVGYLFRKLYTKFLFGLLSR